MNDTNKKLLEEIAEKLKGKILFPEKLKADREYLEKVTFVDSTEASLQKPETTDEAQEEVKPDRESSETFN